MIPVAMRPLRRNIVIESVLMHQHMRKRPALSVMLTTIAAMALAACQHTASAPKIAGQSFYEAGFRAEEQGNLAVARVHFNQAYEFARSRALGPASEAAALYEWSRITGYLGMTAEAEAGFTHVLLLIDASQGRAEKLRALALCELARLLHDTKQHAKAVSVFEQAVNALQKAGAP